MAHQVEVRSVDALLDFERSLGRTRGDVDVFLASARAQTSTVLDWITEREHEAQRSVSHAEDRMSLAQDGLSDCLNSCYDDEDGPPDCSSWEYQVSDIRREMEEATERLDNVRRVAAQVRTAAEDFLRSARGLGSVADEQMRLACLYLQAKTRELNSYLTATPTEASPVAPWESSMTGSLASAASSVPFVAMSSASRFSEKGIVSVNVADIPDEEIGALSVNDFHKYPYEEMLTGARRFDLEVRPAVEAGRGRDYFHQKDIEAAREYEHGLERLYDAYYGSEPIRLTKLKNGRIEVTNGRHRLFVAKQAGVRTVPASMAEEASDS